MILNTVGVINKNYIFSLASQILYDIDYLCQKLERGNGNADLAIKYADLHYYKGIVYLGKIKDT